MAKNATVNHQNHDEACEHGTAMDVHCCNCHSGFLFDIANCVCEYDVCDGCGLATWGDGRYTDDDVFLCGPCYDEVPLTMDGEDRGLKLVRDFWRPSLRGSRGH